MAQRSGYVAKNNFPEPPLKRLYPWCLDNKFGTDIIAGKVETGNSAFKGIIIKDAELHQLKKFLQLAPTHLPESSDPNIQAVSDGYPTVVLTRGVYGRELDTNAGPTRNTATEEIWETVREARLENTRMNITCVDVPAGTTTAEISKCFEPPLNAYRELAYYDGTWFTPEAVSAAEFVKHAKDNPRKTLHQTAVAKAQGREKGHIYARKPFDWVKNEAEDAMWSLVWKPVHTDSDRVPPAVNVDRLTLDFTAPLASRRASPDVPQVHASTVKGAIDAEWRRLQDSANPLDDASSAASLFEAANRYIADQEQAGSAGVEKAKLCAAERVLELIQAAGNKKAEAEAYAACVKAYIAIRPIDEGSITTCIEKMGGLYEELKDIKGKSEAIAKIAAEFIAAGEAEKAVKLASGAQQGVADPVVGAILAEAEVRSLLAAGRTEDALKRASESSFSTESTKAEVLCAAAGVHSAQDEYVPAIEKLYQAKDIYAKLKDVKSEATCLRTVTLLQMRRGDPLPEDAAKLQALANSVAGDAKTQADLLLMSANVNLDLLEKRPESATKAAEQVAADAGKALELYRQSGDGLGQAMSNQALASGMLSRGMFEEAKKLAKEAEAYYKDADVAGKPLVTVLICSAKANVALNQLHSAMWDAKQALVKAAADGEAGGQAAALKIIATVNKMSDRPIKVGRDLGA